MTGALEGADGDPGAPSTYVVDVDGWPPGRHCRRLGSTHHLCRRCLWWAPWVALSETRERPPPMSETSMVPPLGGIDGDPEVPTTYVRDVDGGPLGGAVRDTGSPTTYVKDVDGGPPMRH
jgi:hypothetical protein